MAVDPLQALALIPVALLAGLGAFTFYINRYARDWGWLRSWGDRLNFLLWPRPPGNIVKLIYPDGRVELMYNAEVKESRNSVVLETPLGMVKISPPRPIVTGLNVYVPGRPSPLHFVVGAMAGLTSIYFVMYYGSLLLLGSTQLALASLAVLVYAYMWYQAAMTPNTTMYSAIITSMASGYFHAVPTPGEAISPKEFLRLFNRGIVIRVDKDARRALEEVASMLDVDDISTAAEILASASMYTTLRRMVTSMAAKAASISEVQRSIFSFTYEELRRVTLGRLLVWLIIFAVGAVVGYALGGGDVVIVPAGEVAGLQQP